VLIDYQLGETDGITCYHLLKKQNPKLQAFLFTGNVYEEKLREFSQVYQVPLLYKPLDLDQFHTMLQQQMIRIA